MADFFSNPTASTFWAFCVFDPLRICQRIFIAHTCVFYSLPQFVAIWNRRFYWKPFVLSFKVGKVRFFTKSFALVVKPKETLKKCAPEFDALCMFCRFLKGSLNPWRKTNVPRKVRITFCLFSQSVHTEYFSLLQKSEMKFVDICDFRSLSGHPLRRNTKGDSVGLGCLLHSDQRDTLQPYGLPVPFRVEALS